MASLARRMERAPDPNPVIHRPHCERPEACAAKGNGHCRSCHMRSATKANWQDPAFRERNAAATKAKKQHDQLEKIKALGLGEGELEEWREIKTKGFSGPEAARIVIRSRKASA